MIYRITFGFSGAGTGWAETHAMLSAANNPRDLFPTLRDIAQKRVQMLGREFAIVAIRASRYATDAGVRARGVSLVKERFVNSVTTATAAAEPASVALLVRGSAEPSILNPQYDANQNQTFLGAPLDIAVDNAGVVDMGKGGLGAAFGAWRSAMLNTTMGWLASNTVYNGAMMQIAQNANGTVSFTMEEVFTPALVVGKTYRARVRGVNNGFSPLNGELLVVAKAGNVLTSVAVIGVALDQGGGHMRVYSQVAPFVDYGDLELGGLVGKHKRGRPYGSSPGRARKRIRG